MISVLVGPNRFALQRSLQKTKSDFVNKYGDIAIETIDADEADLDTIQSTVRAVSLFTPVKMVIVKSLSSNKQAAEKIEEIIDSTPDESQLIVVEPQPDKRSAYYKTLKKRIEISEFLEPNEIELERWLVREAKFKNAVLSSSDARYLIARVGAKQGKLHSELTKLIDYNPQISRDDIDEVTEPNPENSVFELLEAAFGGNTDRTLEIYENLRASGNQPQMILAMLAWQMHQVLLVAASGGRSIDEVAAASGAKPFTLQKSRRIAQRLQPQNIKSILKNLLTLDRKMKTQTIDADDALKNVLVRIATSSS